MIPSNGFHSAPHSLVQSAIAAYGRSLAAAAPASSSTLLQQATAVLAQLPHPRVATAEPRGKTAIGAPLLSPHCVALLLQYAEAWITRNTPRQAALREEVHESGCDPGLLSAVTDYADAFWLHHDEIPYVPPPGADSQEFVYPLPEKPSLRIGILSDWGSGDAAAEWALQQLMAQSPDLILHLGDVYYAGTGDEVQRNFLGPLQQYAAGVPVYNLPGNHDMYSGGQAFYAALAGLNQGKFFPGTSLRAAQQGASFFCLKNSWLQLQGMDTGYFDSDLFDITRDTTQLHCPEAEWHLDKLRSAATAECATFLFSHHQAWSPFVGINSGAILTRDDEVDGPMLSFNQHLQSALQDVPLDTVRAWFWGHEHVLEVYDQTAIQGSTLNGAPGQSLPELFPWLPYAACVGYSGFTMLESDGPYQVQYGDDFKLLYNGGYVLPSRIPPDGSDAIYDRGFTILDVEEAGGAVATYYTVPGDGSHEPCSAFPPSTIR